MLLLMKTNWQKALNDIKQGLFSWRIWMLLAWQDIRLRYRRSYLGPFWLTISMAVTIYTIGFLYGRLFNVDLEEYFPFLATGILCWGLISTLLNESAETFISAENYLKQVKLPYVLFILRVVARNLIIFLHNSVVLIPLYFFLSLPINWTILLALFGLFIIAFNGAVYGLLLAMLGARFRDIPQLIVSLVQVSFFLTPIMWDPKLLPEKYAFIVQFNPFAQYLELVRAPLLGELPSWYAIGITGIISIIGLVMALIFFARFRAHIVYWL